jgi:hypothetical protein
MSMKNSNGTIGNRSRDLPRAPLIGMNYNKKKDEISSTKIIIIIMVVVFIIPHSCFQGRLQNCDRLLLALSCVSVCPQRNTSAPNGRLLMQLDT